MSPKELKEAILKYAMEGKLVEQKEEDGFAKDLLAKIKREKEKLVKEGKIKKQKELIPISDAEKPFEIPKSWEWVRLGEVLYTRTGLSYNKNDLDVPCKKK